ncbi:hypothetical protein Sru01_02940 [Sphaerisporangium rufum]|uniref:Clp R domain-containing protein n=1 Tax=Sphaerisporangium rufum TaxID=1381558 RepID=A0A919UYP0_9ACTN|nr:Clp protease N-terminal domain-containing protein [Sphaerisporangium rufum]GII75312.1 hypothetical protein Sru01_02940 [Sphaerisporangium rufum]
MPKINVYLPDELAEAVKEAGVPVSAVCQRALELAVRRVTAIRETTLGDLAADDPTARLTHFTARARDVIKLAVDQARTAGAGHVGTEHLLGGMLAEGGNLALQVLQALEIDPAQVTRGLTRTPAPQPAGTVPHAGPAGPAGASSPEPATKPATGPGAPESATPGASGAPGPGDDTAGGRPGDSPAAEETSGATAGAESGTARHFDGPAAAALELAVTEATALGHNYVGCEHLLLGLVAEPDGRAGHVLRALGAEPRLTRRAVAAALAGYVHLRAQTAAATPPVPPPADPGTPMGDVTGAARPGGDPMRLLTAAIDRQLRPLVERIDRLEARLTPPSEN